MKLDIANEARASCQWNIKTGFSGYFFVIDIVVPVDDIKRSLTMCCRDTWPNIPQHLANIKGH